MSSKVNGGVYGITTQIATVGLSTVTGFSAMPLVVKSQVRQVLGQTLVIGGIGTAHATMFAAGALLSSLVPSYYTVDGPGGFQLAAGGATATVHVIQSIGE